MVRAQQALRRVLPSKEKEEGVGGGAREEWIFEQTVAPLSLAANCKKEKDKKKHVDSSPPAPLASPLTAGSNSPNRVVEARRSSVILIAGEFGVELESTALAETGDANQREEEEEGNRSAAGNARGGSG